MNWDRLNTVDRWYGATVVTDGKPIQVSKIPSALSYRNHDSDKVNAGLPYRRGNEKSTDGFWRGTL